MHFAHNFGVVGSNFTNEVPLESLDEDEFIANTKLGVWTHDAFLSSHRLMCYSARPRHRCLQLYFSFSLVEQNKYDNILFPLHLKVPNLCVFLCVCILLALDNSQSALILEN